MDQPQQREAPGTITIVTSSGCPLCEMAKELVDVVARDHQLSVRIVDLVSPAGTRLARLHRMPFPPLVLIDGQLHGHGRVSERKLRRHLASLQSAEDGGV